MSQFSVATCCSATLPRLDLPGDRLVGARADQAVYQLGLLLLMFAAGSETRRLIQRNAVRTVSLIASFGLVLPFAAGLGLVAALGTSSFMGTADNKTALVLVFGMAVAVMSIRRDCARTQRARGVSFGFFIPIYFAVIGIQLDLIRHFAVLFFLGFLAFACVAKAASVYLGARLSRENKFMSASLAIAMNARGGPGIVLVSTAFAAGIINKTFLVSLVMLSIVTSLAAGSWLECVADRLTNIGEGPRQETAEVPVLSASLDACATAASTQG